MATAAYIAARRRWMKARLVEMHGGRCLDCGHTGPPFTFDFDHRDPAEKSFSITSAGTIAFARLVAEARKCDLVCAICHRIRTHRQRCTGCEHCDRLEAA